MTEMVCLAVVLDPETLRPQLAWEQFTVFINHNSLHWLLNDTKPPGRLLRWRLRLLKFSFDIQNKKEI